MSAFPKLKEIADVWDAHVDQNLRTHRYAQDLRTDFTNHSVGTRALIDSLRDQLDAQAAKIVALEAEQKQSGKFLLSLQTVMLAEQKLNQAMDKNVEEIARLCRVGFAKISKRIDQTDASVDNLYREFDEATAEYDDLIYRDDETISELVPFAAGLADESIHVEKHADGSDRAMVILSVDMADGWSKEKFEDQVKQMFAPIQNAYRWEAYQIESSNG